MSLSPRVRAWLRSGAAPLEPGGPLDDLDALRTDQHHIDGDFRRALARLAAEVSGEKPAGDLRGSPPPGL